MTARIGGACRALAVLSTATVVTAVPLPVLAAGNEAAVDRFVVRASIADVRKAVIRGDHRCRDIVAAYQRRIAVYDHASGLNAITVVNGDASRAAETLDREWRGREDAPPLLCAPLLIKDNVDTAGMETAGGSMALQGLPVGHDASIVRVLRTGGAIVIAKTNMAEWAFSPRQTVSSSHGVTANAYSLAFVPAGSSGGTASGVAAAFGVAGIGTDTGNSVRGPSSHLALVGLRPSLGVVSRSGIVPLSFDRDTAGPMARSARDAALIMNAIAFADDADPYTTHPEVKRAADYGEFLDTSYLRGKRIGVLRALARPAESDPEILVVFERALRDLEAAGARMIDPFVVPGFDDLVERDSFCLRFAYDLSRYLEARGIEDDNLSLDALISDRRHGTDPRVRAGLELMAGKPADIHPRDWHEPCPDFFEHPDRLEYRNAIIEAMRAQDIAALAYPTWTRPPAALDRGNEDYGGDNSQLVAPATGLPAITVPMGWVRDMLPVGLQLLGTPYTEPELLGLTYAYEAATGHHHPPPAFPALD